MIKIPYGISDFQTLIDSDYYYQDRTVFIEKLEKWPSQYPVFLRPRRFGKSLFVSTLHNYYGLEYKADFKKIFGNLYIGKKPTKLANSYMVLRFEFSRIDTYTHESTYQGFLNNVISGVRRFMSAYSSFFTTKQVEFIETCKSPESVVNTLFDFIKQNKITHKVYVLIDEYDHFANELLSFDIKRFKDDVSRNGFVRKFYESLKAATGEGIVDRIFITGVSPITLDSLTSGFNISSNITLNPLFHDMMGFTHTEVEAILHESKIAEEKIPILMSDLTEWYDGYRFSSEALPLLFNPDMVLYFLQEYSIQGKYPEKMLDTNVISDYRKIRNIFKIGNEEDALSKLIEELRQNKYIDFSIFRSFNLESGFSDDDFLSFLFYMGMLSFKEKTVLDWRCEIPNLAVNKLYSEYLTANFS